MTETDKIEIGNLLKGITDMQKYAMKTNEIYLDDKIVDFATKAKEDYLSNKEYIKGILKDNLGMFINLNPLEISNHSNEGINASHGLKTTLSIGNNIIIIVRLTDFDIIKGDYYKYTFSVRGIEICDILFRTSDVDDENYGVCCWENLVDRCEPTFVFNKPTNAKNWEYIYNRAVRTRKMNAILVEKFKQTMNDRIAYFRSIANSNEKTKEMISNIGEYTKVDL